MAFLESDSPMVTASEAIHSLARLLRALGVRIYQKTLTGKPDYRAMADQAIERIEELTRDAVEARKSSAKMFEQMTELRAQLDAAQAEAAEAEESRECERSRARMRLLEVVFRAEMTPDGVLESWLMPSCLALRENGKPSDPVKVRAALLADLDALVALGLKGEVGA